MNSNAFRNLTFSKYKCFKDEVTLDIIRTSNFFIGKNNIGKSCIMEILGNIASESIKGYNVSMEVLLNRENIINHYRADVYTGYDSSKTNWTTIGSTFEGKYIKIETSYGWTPRYVPSQSDIFFEHQNDDKFKSMVSKMQNPFKDFSLKKISAERDIAPEAHSSNFSIESNGNGTTNYIQSIINLTHLDSKLIQKDVLESFNEILYPEVQIKNIVVQLDYQTQYWEIYFDTEFDRIPLSNSGSGLKTILLVLLNLLVIPKCEKKELSQYIFIFEELENNLHPSLQRRLLNYIHSFALENNCTIFYTTHSNVIIDMFSNRDDSTIYLVKKVEDKTTIKRVDDYLAQSETLNELEIKASDILQTNVLIWVEGPSDRVYINKFISLLDSTLIENVHYQFVYYGGRLLSHISVDPIEITDLVSIFKINRNSIVIIDSDKKDENARINPTKSRIKKELTSLNLICWITDGREIENYIPIDVLENYYGFHKNVKFGSYDDIKVVLNSIKSNEGNKFERNKVKFANEYSQFITSQHMLLNPSLSKTVQNCINFIKAQNHI